MSETEIQSSIIDYLTILEKQGKLHFWRLNNIPPVQKGINGDMKFRRMPKGSKKGIPDILVVKDRRTIGIEVKSKTGRQSVEQKQIEAELIKQGAEYYIVRSVVEVKQVIGVDGIV